MSEIDTDNIRARVDEFIRTDEILALCEEVDRLRIEVEGLRPKGPKVKVEIYPAPQREIVPIRVACPRCGHR